MGAIKLQIKSRSGRDIFPDGLVLPDTATVEQLQQRFAELKPKYYPSRQRFTLPPPVDGSARSGPALVPGKRLIDYGLADGSVLLFKDLGPQIGYRTVFFWEYLGPLLVYPLFYLLPHLAYPSFHYSRPKVLAQQLALAYWSFHYAKRILETFLVHKFSHGTMPVFNLVKNCSYYWGFAAFVSYFTVAALALALLFQLGNLRCHAILAGLRPGGGRAAAGGGAYQIPCGFLFNYITCANYTCEILGWTLAAAVFTVVGAAQMAQWAAGKHRRLRNTFDGQEGREKYPRRWVMLPPFF
eukprot:scaffold22.g6051.t1